MNIKINMLLGFSFQLATLINIGVLIQAVIFVASYQIEPTKKVLAK